MSSSIFDDITADKVKALREQQGIGLMVAKDILQRMVAENAMRQLHAEGLVDHRLRDVLIYLIGRR